MSRFQTGQSTPRVAIAGAGISGLCLAIRLKQAGIESFSVFEKSDAVGGTWSENTYPGAACDIPSALYSFSFAPNPDWSRKHAPQREILEYFRKCADDFEIVPHIRFSTMVESATYDESTGTWEVATSDGHRETFDVFVSAVGQLNRPVIPPIPGAESFAGPAFHTAKWNHDCDLRDRNVAIIGTGASAIQIVPQIAKQVRRLTVFQRSPTWICRFSNYRYPRWIRAMFRHLPWTERLHRWWIYLCCEYRFTAFRAGSLESWVYTNWLRFKMRWTVKEPLRSQLTPDFVAGCKRILMSNDYYAALERDNVDLVTTPIERIAAGGVVTSENEHPADAVLFATGFQTTDLLVPMEVIGRDGRRLADDWRARPGTYLGLMPSGYPNFFMLYGPNTNLGHNSIIFMIECQVNFIMKCVGHLRRTGLQSLEVRQDAVDRLSDMVQRRLKRTVWAGNCTNWYKTESGQMINNWCGTTLEYWWRTRKPDFSQMTVREAAAPEQVGSASNSNDGL